MDTLETVLVSLLGGVAFWEFARWLIGFGRKREYLDYSNEIHIKDLERAYGAMDKLETKLNRVEKEKYEAIKQDIEKTGTILRLEIELEEQREECKKLKERVADLEGGQVSEGAQGSGT